MASASSKLTGELGVVISTTGPGATNAITGLTDALMDSIPIICLSGQVPTHLIGTDAFQEADTTGISRPCTKHNYLVKDAEKLCEIIHKSFEIASTGRPGPVLIDLPKDIQLSKIKYVTKVEAKEEGWMLYSETEDLRPYVSMFSQENNLVILTLQLEQKSLSSVFKDLTK